MEAEELIKYLKKCCEVFGEEFEPIITPTKGNPNEQQYDVSIIIMERRKNGQIPRFHLNIKDLEALRKLNENE